MANISGGSVVWNLDIDNSKFNSKLKQASGDIGGIEKTTATTAKNSNKAFESIAKIGIASVAAAAIAAGALITKNIGNAVRRVDTLNNFPKIMQNLGYQTDESAKALGKLDMGVRGLPTSLDQIASAMQNIAPSSRSLEEATNLTLALNNALIAGGKPADLQASAMEQFSQAIAKGKPDMMEWRSLATAMPGQMKQLANSLGYDQWQTMADAVTKGDLAFSKVTDQIVALNTKGLGEFPSFADQAKNSAGGLQTGMANLNTAVARGIATVIQSIGSDKISSAFSSIGKSLETALKSFAGFIKFVERNSDVIMPFVVAISTLVGLLTAWYVAAKIVAAVQAVLNAVMAANPIGLIVIAIAALVAGLVFFFTKTETGRKIFAKFTEILKKGFNVIVGAGKKVVNFFKNNWKIIAAVALAPLLPIIAVIALVVKNFDHIKSAAETVWTVIQTVFSAIWSFLQPILKFISDLFIIVFGGIAILVIMAVQKIYQIVTSVLSAVWGFIKPILNAIKDFFVAVWSGIYNVVKTYLTLMYNFYSAIFTAIYNIIKSIVTGIINFFAPAVTWLYQKGKDIVQGLINGIVNLANGVWNAIKTVADKIGSFFSGAWDWLYGVGKAIIEGLIRGITGMAGKVTKAVSDTANNIKNKFKDLLGIHSPSKVFANYGSDIGEGLMRGIDKTKAAVDTAMAGLTGQDVRVQASMVPTVADTETVSSGGQDVSVKVEVNMSGIMARSRTDLRDIGVDLIEAVNEGLRAKNLPQIGGGKILEVSTNG